MRYWQKCLVCSIVCTHCVCSNCFYRQKQRKLSYSNSSSVWVVGAVKMIVTNMSRLVRHTIIALVFGRPFVNWFALCYYTVVCPVCLFLTLVYCGQTVGLIKLKLGVQVGRGPGHIVLDGDPAPPLPKGYSPSPNFRPISVVAKWLDGLRCHLVWR